MRDKMVRSTAWHSSPRRSFVLQLGSASSCARSVAVLAFAVLVSIGCTGRQSGNPTDSDPETLRPIGSANTSTGQPDDGMGRLVTSESERRRESDDQTFDPASDGWESESFVAAADKSLKEIVSLLADPTQIRADRLTTLVSDGFQGSALYPPDMIAIHRDDSIVVRRASITNVEQASPGSYRGPDGLATALVELAQSLRAVTDPQLHVKTYGVHFTESQAETTVDFEAHGPTDTGSIQHNATWACQWERTRDSAPHLVSIRLLDFEEIIGQATHHTWFADCTAAALGRNSSFHEQLLFGLNHWLHRIERIHRMQIYARTGLAVGDMNGDGLDDVYVCQPAGLPNRLFVHAPDGTATDTSSWAGVDWLDETHGALFIDLDNDGDQDLALSCTAGVLLMENDSTGKFRWRAKLPMERSVEALSAVDFDHDGDLDLYTCVYRADQSGQGRNSAVEFVYHDANDGGTNRLYRSELSTGKWEFTDVTQDCGLDADNRRWSLAAAWEDYDNDGDQDLYVANDYGRNCLYRNDAGRFVNVAEALGVVDFGSSMSVSWGDYNHDGWMDLYVGNMFSSAGSRVTSQDRFMTRSDEGTRALYRRFAKGNSLFANVEGQRFREVGAEAAAEMARWAWSSLFVDVNNDGWEDLYVANGFITADDPRDL
jgi:hypothetical protein